jgi:Flp pilus assembly pilin Flp
MLLIQRFWADESGFLISAELVLISTITVIGMVVGLAEVMVAITAELNDVANAIGSLNQSFSFSGFSARTGVGSLNSSFNGSIFIDFADACDNNQVSDMLISPTIGVGG